jgi:hypothetical protein
MYFTSGTSGSPVTYTYSGNEYSNFDLTIKIPTNVAGAYDFTF